jgi:enamine deaminase RidA (YjgF/YER057c/UK114 family)
VAADIKRWPCDHKLSDMVEHGGLLYLAGQVAENLAASAKGQTAEVLAMIDRLLAGAGSDKSKLLSAVIFIPDMRDKPLVDEAWLAWADPKSLPARAVLEARLGSPDTRVEIVCVAAK